MSIQYWSASADYLTATFPRDSSLGDRLTVARRAVEVAESQGEGFDKRPASWYGYAGWQIGRVFFGEREDGWMVRATGHVADSLAFTLPVATTSIARIDLCVTCWFEQDDMMVAKERHQAAVVSRETRRAAGKLKIRLEDGTGDGDTLYLGSRNSQVFGRVYDKWRESADDHYKHAWRWEVQVKDRTADKVYREIDREPDRARCIGATVTDWFSSRGVDCPAASFEGPPVPICAPRERSDLNKRLEWLHRQVRPVVRKLLRDGHESDILAALGLTGSIGCADKDLWANVLERRVGENLLTE